MKAEQNCLMLKIMKNDFDSNCCWIFQAAEKEMLGK